MDVNVSRGRLTSFYRDRYLWMIAGALLLASLAIAFASPIELTDNDGNMHRESRLVSLGTHAVMLIVGGLFLSFVIAAPFGAKWTRSRYWEINETYRRGFVIVLIVLYALWTYFAVMRIV